MRSPNIVVDFNNADSLGRVRLNTVGSVDSLARSGLRLTPGLSVVVTDGDLSADGVVERDAVEGWVVRIVRYHHGASR